MKKPIGLTLLSAALCAAAPAGAMTLKEQSIDVPGFADFLVVDGDTVWTTNDGRVEQWAVDGKKASVEVPRPCGTMAIAFGSLWVANCKGGDVYRIDPKTKEVLAKIPAGLGPSGELNVVAGAGYIWAPNETAGTIARIDPATNAVVASINVAASSPVAVANHHGWSAGEVSITAFRPRTSASSRSPVSRASQPR